MALSYSLFYTNRIKTELGPYMPVSIVSLTEFKSKAAKFIADLKDHPQSLVLTQNGRATAVVQDMETYQRHLDAITMLKLVTLGETDIKKGKLIPQNQVFTDLKKRIKNDPLK